MFRRQSLRSWRTCNTTKVLLVTGWRRERVLVHRATGRSPSYGAQSANLLDSEWLGPLERLFGCHSPFLLTVAVNFVCYAVLRIFCQTRALDIATTLTRRAFCDEARISNLSKYIAHFRTNGEGASRRIRGEYSLGGFPVSHYSRMRDIALKWRTCRVVMEYFLVVGDIVRVARPNYTCM